MVYVVHKLYEKTPLKSGPLQKWILKIFCQANSLRRVMLSLALLLPGPVKLVH